jgi:hypothetical protein
VIARLMVIFLCLGILSTVTGCYVELTPDGTSYRVGAYQGESYRGGTDYERRQYRRHWGEQDGTYHPWERPGGYGSLN